MAVAKRCDRCGKFYEASPENMYSYEENGEKFYVDSIRLGKWNAKTKGWDNIISAYDLCKECASDVTRALLDKGELVTRKPDKNFKGRYTAQKQDDDKEGEEV